MFKITLSYNNSFPHNSVRKESASNAGDPSLILWSGRSPGEGKGYPLQYSGLENSKEFHGVAKSQTGLSDFHFHNNKVPTLIEFLIWWKELEK